MHLVLCLISDMSQYKNVMNEMLGKMLSIMSYLMSNFYVHRTTLLSDIRRILYPPSVFNRIVFDFDTMINNSTTCRLDNDDEQR